MINLLYYLYTDIGDTKQFMQDQEELCKKLNILGRILIADEGINGNLTGKKSSIEAYKKALKKDKRFKGIEFKEGTTNNHNFKKLTIRLRKEIVTSEFGKKGDVKNKADYIEPKQLKKLLDSKEEVILVDARNDYEAEIGKFKNAVILPIKTFREFPEAVNNIKNLKEKKIITYCTGGIRCEKASAYMKSTGFKNVQQLHGGIIKYGKECSTAHWEGKCFVFDNRGAVEIDPKKQTEPITQCATCHIPIDKYYNCANVACDKRFIACNACLHQQENCCSKNCKNIAIKKAIPSTS
ncbi:MAG: rhodanese-related sulfurtransferase [Nanoarchaeota archaeon]|nr:rhodanese-related sulfurtransferase [Nanoarchaeota archaeon]